MADPQAKTRILVDLLDDIGADPSCEFDSSGGAGALLEITGHKVQGIESFVLGPTDADVPLEWGADQAALVVVSMDYPFSYRLAAAETLVPDQVAAVFWGKDETVATIPAAGILLTGNGSNEAMLRVIRVQKA